MTNTEDDTQTTVKSMISLPMTILTLFNITASIMLVLKMTALFGILFGICGYIVIEIFMTILMVYNNKDIVLALAGKVSEETIARKIIARELPTETLVKTILLAILFYGSKII